MKTLHFLSALTLMATAAVLGGCVSVEDDGPTRSRTTTTTTAPSVMAPSTTVERTTTTY